ncbi:MAG: CoA pyrophosphatase [Hyphomicrobiales bacterium]|nr:CoA pyrophosphatase [Hyphomicrobiales bacterium]
MNVAATDRLPASQFRQNVIRRLENSSGDSAKVFEGDHILNPDVQDALVNSALKAAAVLMPIVERQNGLSVVFTKRTEKLKSHSGQVSFPGGKIDESDESALFAALRETEEEIGVGADAIEILGQLPDYYTGSGYHISPVVGMMDAKVEFVANPHEVEHVFEVPLDFLMNPDNHHINSRVFENIERYYYVMPWGKHHVWGVTAGIVRMFYNQVFK